MITLSRGLARSFRSVMRRSVMASFPRGPAPPVLAVAGPEGLTLRAAYHEVGLTLRLPIEGADSDKIAFRGDVLAGLEGTGSEPVTLEAVSADKGQARFQDRGVPQVVDFDLIDADETPDLLLAKRRLTPMPPGFLKALDDACRTASRDEKLALHRIQLRGKAGQIVASDGKQLLVQGGFPLPFGADILVPALPVFGAREFANADPVCLGRSDGRLLLRAGSWCFDLKIDTLGRFPNVDKVIPSSTKPTRLTVDEGDAQFLLEAIPSLEGSDDEPPLITLDLGQAALIRARGDSASTEVCLCNSRVTSQPIRVCFDRQYFVRALRLGFRSFEVHGPDRPLLARADERLYVFAVLSDKLAVEASPDTVRLMTTATVPAQASNAVELTAAQARSAPGNHPSEERNPIMATSHNGTNGHQDQPEAFDPLTEAEALKVALQEALNRSTRLIAGLRQVRKQHKAVASAMASLRQFQLTP